MNTLGRDIEKGEVVILNSKYYIGTIQQRMFTCHSGSGMRISTYGTAIYGTFADGEKARVEGFEIDKLKTNTYSILKEHEPRGDV